MRLIVIQGPDRGVTESIMYRINSDQSWVIEYETRASVRHTPHTRPSTFALQTSTHATAVFRNVICRTTRHSFKIVPWDGRKTTCNSWRATHRNGAK